MYICKKSYTNAQNLYIAAFEIKWQIYSAHKISQGTATWMTYATLTRLNDWYALHKYTLGTRCLHLGNFAILRGQWIPMKFAG